VKIVSLIDEPEVVGALLSGVFVVKVPFVAISNDQVVEVQCCLWSWQEPGIVTG
jgi:hypothetical protein